MLGLPEIWCISLCLYFASCLSVCLSVSLVACLRFNPKWKAEFRSAGDGNGASPSKYSEGIQSLFEYINDNDSSSRGNDH